MKQLITMSALECIHCDGRGHTEQVTYHRMDSSTPYGDASAQDVRCTHCEGTGAGVAYKSAADIEAALQLTSSTQSQAYGVYLGVSEINGHLSAAKVGRTINVRALQRGRNQGGANWWFIGFWPLRSKEETYEVERELKLALKAHKTPGRQGQRELYGMHHQRIYDELCDILGNPL